MSGSRSTAAPPGRAPAAKRLPLGSLLGGLCVLAVVLPAQRAQAAPPPPINLAASPLATWGTIFVSWEPAVGGPTPDHYQIFRNHLTPGAVGPLIDTTSDIEYEDVLAQIGNRWYWVAACDAGGSCSAPAGPVMARGTLGPPPQTQNLTIAPFNFYVDRLFLSWDQTRRTLFYNVYRQTDLTPPPTAPIATVNALEFSDITAAPNTLYYYWVAPCNDHGCGPLSDFVQGQYQTSLSDADLDAVNDTFDNCPTVPNGPNESLLEGIGNQTNTDVDLYGDACECGDVNDDGKFHLDDVPAFRTALADSKGSPLPPSGALRCNSTGQIRPCDMLDVTVLRRAEAFPQPLTPTPIQPVCEAGGCEHSMCAYNAGPLTPVFCSLCVGQVCENDPFCCDVDWDVPCMEQAMVTCPLETVGCVVPGSCVGGFDICVVQTPDIIPPQCDACVSDVCSGDPICCDDTLGLAAVGWDEYCVAAVDGVCPQRSCP